MTPPTVVHRVEVRPRPGRPDPRAESFARQARAAGARLESVSSARVYLIEGAFEGSALERVMRRLLADPVTEVASAGASAARDASTVEVHPLPGVMDPAAQSVREAIADLVGAGANVSTGVRYDLRGVSTAEARELALRLVANPVVHQITAGAWTPAALPAGHAYTARVRHAPIRDLTDEQLVKMSRAAHLFLSLEEMRAVQAEYRRLGREPTDIELETIAQTWSEHCVHKTLKSTIRYRTIGPEAGGDPIDWSTLPGHERHADGSVTIRNLLKSTVAAATFELIDEGVDWALSVFKDNSGVVALDDAFGVCIKVETHNHPSAIEPYGGAATGAGGCIRDVIGTGLGAKPIASTDVFCVAFPGGWKAGPDAEGVPLPPGTIHPRRTLTDVVAGVRDYGNRMGIPTVNGAVYFDDRYVGNPLVFCGCVGLIPRGLIRGKAGRGDRIIALGGRTGRDGIHGATFSSAELEQGHADEFSHAVQIGNAIEEKRLLDAILRARDAEKRGPLFNAITDCGAGGFSSAVGEMGAELGAEVRLDRAPLKYAGLSYTEIWISEAQERMVLAVPPGNVATLRRICDEEHVELADLGHFGTDNADLILYYKDLQVGRLPMHFLHEGIPTPVREAVWAGSTEETKRRGDEVIGPGGPAIGGTGVPPVSGPHQALDPSAHFATPTLRHSATSWSLGLSVSSSLLSLLGHPTIASKHWIIRQYDHEVQGNTVVKPLVGPALRGPGDAAVLEPVPGSGRGIAIACGLGTPLGDPEVPTADPYQMALAAIDECVRNLVCVGADPGRIAILDNFCWPSCARPDNLGSLVRAAEGCYAGAKAYRTPFVSGKDSLNNQLRYTDPVTGRERVVEIPPTLLITGLGIVPAITRCVTMDAKRAGNVVLLVGETTAHLAGSLFWQRCRGEGAALPAGAVGAIPAVDLRLGPAAARVVAGCIRGGLIASAHDASEGGLLVALAEMLIGAAPAQGGAGPALGLDVAAPGGLDPAVFAFAETPSRYVLEVRPADEARVRSACAEAGVAVWALGTLTTTGRLVWPGAALDVPVADLARAWLTPLDW